MTITKIKYERQFPIGPYLQERIGFEADIDGDNESEQMAIETLRDLAEKSNREKYPHLYTENGKPVIIVQNDPVDNRIASLIEDINACTEIHQENSFGVQVGLIAYLQMALNNPELKAAYDLRLKQLQK